MQELSPYPLYAGHDRFAWHAKPWTEYLKAASEKPRIAILPIYSLTDWGLGRPLDAEEVVGSALLDRALHLNGDVSFTVVPPMRITPRQSIGNCFAQDIEWAHQLLAETVVSASHSHVNRFVLFNTSPFLEEWVDVVARDLRVRHGYEMFCLNLSGLDADFHPIRGGTRVGLQAILDVLLGPASEDSDVFSPEELDPSPELLVPVESSTDLVELTGSEGIEHVAKKMAQILKEISEFPAFPDRRPNAGGAQ